MRPLAQLNSGNEVAVIHAKRVGNAVQVCLASCLCVVPIGYRPPVFRIDRDQHADISVDWPMVPAPPCQRCSVCPLPVIAGYACLPSVRAGASVWPKDGMGKWKLNHLQALQALRIVHLANLRFFKAIQMSIRRVRERIMLPLQIAGLGVERPRCGGMKSRTLPGRSRFR